MTSSHLSRGSLARVLTKIAEGGINLSKLQSMPIPGSEWEYSFHADMEFEDLAQFFQHEVREIADQIVSARLGLRNRSHGVKVHAFSFQDSRGQA